MHALRRWSVRHAGWMEFTYALIRRGLRSLHPLATRIGRQRLEAPVAGVEAAVKGLLFDCSMCGRCVLHRTGMSCPGNCPKRVRNGPCGGVRADGNCEVDPGMRCVWVEGWEGSLRMHEGVLPRVVNPPIEHDQVGRSSWLPVMTHERDDHIDPPPGQAPAAPAAHPPASRLEALLNAGTFVVTAEFPPPDSADPEEVRAMLAHFRGHVDAVNVTDASGANCHMSSLATSRLLLEAGCEPVMQVTCRDRNRIAIQGDLLGAAALGIHNVLCLTGDDTGNGDHPGAKGVWDLDSVTLLELARTLRDESRFLSGRRLSRAPSLFLGAADNPFAPPFEARVERLAKKAMAGAQFAQTQYCFDLEVLARYLDALRAAGLDERVKLLVGVGPIASAKTARWLRTRVPGVHVPDAVVDRLERAADPRAEGRLICVETMRALRQMPGVAGVHLMAYRHESAIGEMVAASGVLDGRTPAFAAPPEYREGTSRRFALEASL